MRNTIENLNDNPIFAMSLHSKELFHSNFWAWLFKHNYEYVKIFFDDFRVEDGKNYIVEREQNNRDITIWYDGKAYVVENKFKSIPRLEQLLDYQEKLKGNFNNGVITGIVDPKFACENLKWKFLSYNFICNQIISVADKFEQNSFEKELIIKYANMTLELFEIINDKVINNKNTWVVSDDFSDLAQIKMDDIAKKLIASMLAEYLDKRFSEESLCRKVGNYNLVIESGYSHKHAIVDCRFVQNIDSDKPSVIGIQIEDAQYRRCIQINKALTDEEIEMLFNKFVDLNWFTDYDNDKNILNGRKTSMRKKYGKYSTKAYTFLYQYWNIEDESFENIVMSEIYDLKEASKLI